MRRSARAPSRGRKPDAGALPGRSGAASPDPQSRAGRRIGALAGLAAISCCVYPLVLFLLGLSTGSAAISLGNRLYGTWAWVFRAVATALAAAAVGVHLARRGRCSLDGVRDSRTLLLWLAGTGIATYLVLYGVTKALAAWGT